MNKRTIAVIAALALGLSGCTTPPPVSPPEPTATPQLPTAASLVVGSETLTVLADDGTELASYSYFEPDAGEAIMGLTDIFGFRAELTEQEAESHHPRTTIHVWNGFELWEYHDTTPSSPDVDAFRVVVTTAAVGDIAISAEGGVTVGMEEVAAAPRAFQQVANNGNDPVDTYLYDETLVETTGVPDSGPPALSTRAWVTGKDRLVTRIDAPMRNWGP